jgi:alpha-1,2-mannosyltransferase
MSTATGLRFFAAIALPLFVLYLATATWTLPYHIDTITNVFTAWELANDGDAVLEEHEALASPDYFGNVGWVVPAQDSVAAQYPPGAALLATPLYTIWPDNATILTVYGSNRLADGVEIPVPPLPPAAISAAAVSAMAVGLTGLAFRRLVDSRTALVAAYVAGLGTGAWSVAADQLWQHGPAMMWIAAGTLLSAERQVWAGVAFGAAILTRPHTALVAAGNGLVQAVAKRTVRPAIRIGIGSAMGLALLVAYNTVVFGAPSIAGGYGSGFNERTSSLDLVEYAGNIALALVHPLRGLLIFSPFLILLIPGLKAAWRAAPAWVQGSALGGLLYLLLQLKANRYSGGSGFWGYRYPLETLAAAAPLLLLAYSEWVERQSELIRKLFRWLVIASVLLTATGAIVY